MKPLPFISVKNSRLICDMQTNRKKLSFPATRKGGMALGRALRKAGIDEWINSSSVDHPGEYGGRKIDMRKAIGDGWMNPCAKCGIQDDTTQFYGEYDVDLCKPCMRKMAAVLVKAVKKWLAK